MQNKSNLKLIALMFICLSFIGGVFYFTQEEVEEPIEKIEHNHVEKIPLYYNLADPTNVYTRNKDGEFEVITDYGTG